MVQIMCRILFLRDGTQREVLGPPNNSIVWFHEGTLLTSLIPSDLLGDILPPSGDRRGEKYDYNQCCRDSEYELKELLLAFGLCSASCRVGVLGSSSRDAQSGSLCSKFLCRPIIEMAGLSRGIRHTVRLARLSPRLRIDYWRK